MAYCFSFLFCHDCGSTSWTTKRSPRLWFTSWTRFHLLLSMGRSFFVALSKSKKSSSEFLHACNALKLWRSLAGIVCLKQEWSDLKLLLLAPKSQDSKPFLVLFSNKWSSLMSWRSRLLAVESSAPPKRIRRILCFFQWFRSQLLVAEDFYSSVSNSSSNACLTPSSNTSLCVSSVTNGGDGKKDHHEPSRIVSLTG